VPAPGVTWPRDKSQLFVMGERWIKDFCELNNIPCPTVAAHHPADWHVNACAYYRPAEGIKICLEECGHPCTNSPGRNWTWPAGKTDREPFGVLCHELGHHLDWLASSKKGDYGGNFSSWVRTLSGDKPLTGYCDNDWEWFAEMARLYVSNHGLLRLLRPRTYDLLCRRWKPLGTADWRARLGVNCPRRVVASLQKQFVGV
jgi:hypothetical protein